ncbi:hypothetical protein [Acidicapsa ligni]|uniref:hypothetical protein n=1 Tax=Acidicapsa ligni TaxID=542300 RepID=UPI0021E039C2|nr:hypothetical protein [Acidicapsa ligni]
MNSLSASGHRGDIPSQSDMRKLRATQNIVSFMGFAWSHPSLVAIEVGWRWLFGIPFLYILRIQAQQILIKIPPESAGLDRLDGQNPWRSSVILANAASLYLPEVIAVLHWLVPVAILVWAMVSGLGRSLVLHRMNGLNGGAKSTFSRHLPGIILAQGLWLVAELGFFYLWFRGVSWAAATHLTTTVNPDLLGYLCWVIVISLGLFTAWAFTSWIVGIVPVLLVEENCSLVAAIGRSFRLGKSLSSKLAEVNLVMSIVRIALIILAMVFCAAPLPFSDQFGQGTMNNLYVVIGILYLIANDLFQIVRLKSYQSLRQHYRG